LYPNRGEGYQKQHIMLFMLLTKKMI